MVKANDYDYNNDILYIPIDTIQGLGNLIDKKNYILKDAFKAINQEQELSFG